MTRPFDLAFRRRRYVAVVAGFVLVSLAGLALRPGSSAGLPPVQAVVLALAVAGFGAGLPWLRARFAVLAVASTAPVGATLGMFSAGAGITGVAAWSALACLVFLGLTGPLLDRLTARRAPMLRARAGSRLPAAAIWTALVPTPGHQEANCDAADIRFAAATGRPGRAPQRLRLVVIEVDKPYHIRAAVVPTAETAGREPDGRPMGIVEMALVDLGDRRLVLVRGEPGPIGFADWVSYWLEDRLGRELDRRLATLTARPQDRPAALASARASGRV